MKKLELIQLHRLMDNVREHMKERFPEFLDEEKFFSEYESLDVSPIGIKTNKDEQKQALLELNDALIDFSQNSGGLVYDKITDLSELDAEELNEKGDDELVKFGARIFSEKGVRRPEAAKELSKIVDYTPSTVYDKFSDFGIRFHFHGEEKRTSALKDLNSYAEESLDREEALELVSQDYDVPKGTLKNWLTEEDIRFTEEVSAILTPESREELIHTAEQYFDFRSDVEPMEQALDRDRETLKGYKEGEIKTVPVELLETLDGLFNSEPLYRMDDPERYIEEENSRGLVLDDDFQEFLFSNVSTNEFTEITGSSRSSYTRYTQNKTKNVDKEAYRKIFQVVSYMYSKNPEPEIEAFVDRNSYGSSSEGFEDSVLDTDNLPYEVGSLSG